eukprot:11657071-Alexandrium_andersonii.AAC.1
MSRVAQVMLARWAGFYCAIHIRVVGVAYYVAHPTASSEKKAIPNAPLFASRETPGSCEARSG